MRLGESSIDYMSRVRGIAQRVHGVTIDRIITLFAITSLDHEVYPGAKSRYLISDKTSSIYLVCFQWVRLWCIHDSLGICCLLCLGHHEPQNMTQTAL